ncbi:MAG TPA: GntR family transcriptional regulator, partial [Brevibacterium sp.]|nr:GntR family transcriptional regulator [Brevibacterium sp.]
RINPATAAKGVSELVDRGILYKKRGIGMFVTTGARTRLVDERTQGFAHAYIAPLLAEARRLRLGPQDVIRLITEQASAPQPPERAPQPDQPAHRSPQEA